MTFFQIQAANLLNPVTPGKVVLMLHDFDFELGANNLRDFIGIAKRNGYNFETIDQY